MPATTDTPPRSREQRSERPGPEPQPRGRSYWHPASLLLIAAMAVGSVIMWIGVPLGLVVLASSMTESTTPSLGPYLVVILGLPAGMLVVGKLLGMLDRQHGRVVGTLPERREQTFWLKSMRGESTRQRRRSVLDVVMVASVGLALVGFGVWFFGFAGSSLPT